MTLIVIRGVPGSKKDGWWWDTERMEKTPRDLPSWWMKSTQIVLEPTGVYERRSDGATAEVFRPVETRKGEE